MPHDRLRGRCCEFLYKDHFNLTADSPVAPAITAIERMHEIHELFSLAKHYQLPNLQSRSIGSSARLACWLGYARYILRLGEHVLRGARSHDVGPFKAYFARVAPVMLRGKGRRR